MKKKAFLGILLSVAFHLVISDSELAAQVRDSKPAQERKLEKQKEQEAEFARTDSLVNSRQFVFQPEFGIGVATFVVIDSPNGEVQVGQRNNLNGPITEFEVKRNQKKQNLTVVVKIRGVMSSADLFLFLGSNGKGHATIKFNGQIPYGFPKDFSFDGHLREFENASIQPGSSHFIL